MNRLFTSKTRLRLALLCASVHIAALAAMPLVLANGLPPGELAKRMEFIAAHAFWWGIGWFLWALAGLSLIIFFLAWLDSLPHKAWAIVGVGLASLGGLVDWIALIIQVTLAPDWAGRATSDNFYLNLYIVWDRAFMVFSPGLANLLDTLGGIVMIAASYSTRGFPRWLAWWGLAVWLFGLMLAYAALAGEYSWITLISTGVFGLFVPWVVALGYRWFMIGTDKEQRPSVL